MLQSRKIVFVKTLRDNSGTYIRGMIKKSYGTNLTVRPAELLYIFKVMSLVKQLPDVL